MCVALICPPKVRPSLPLLEACHRANPHGAGIAWRERGRIHYRKGLRYSEVHQLAGEKAGELVIHFRWASVGGVDPGLCHPFPITAAAELKPGGTAAAVLFHNGTWHDWPDALPEIGDLAGPLSDTRIAAALSAQIGTRHLRRLPGRWAVMKRSEIELHGEWLQYRGMLVSNRAFERYLTPPRRERAEIRASTRKEQGVFEGF
jgi:hypothetical protein